MDELVTIVRDTLATSGGVITWSQFVDLIPVQYHMRLSSFCERLEAEKIAHRYVGRDETGKMALTIRAGQHPRFLEGKS